MFYELKFNMIPIFEPSSPYYRVVICSDPMEMSDLHFQEKSILS